MPFPNTNTNKNAEVVAALQAIAATALLVACSGASSSPTPAGVSGAGGTAGNPSGGAGVAGIAGSVSSAGASGAGGSTDGAAGTAPSGGALAMGGAGLAGSAGGNGGSNAGGSHAGGSNAGGATSFVCNQVTAMTLTREWFEAGFELDRSLVDGRWQLKAREHGYITEWANPNSDFWNEPVASPCTAGSTNPDHVVLTVLSWNPACCTTQPEWEAKIDAAIANLQAKYSALKRIDLMTVIRGPGNMLCPTPPVANETIVIPPELDAALAASAAKLPQLVFVAPKFEAPNCAAFNGGGPHLTTAGNTAVAKVVAAYFADLQ
ncbi:MAG: hypothetical protein ABUL60_16080 [Myxococcales bacterium]